MSKNNLAKTVLENCICSELFNSICTYISGGEVRSGSHHGQFTSLPIIMAGVNCAGHEQEITDCSVDLNPDNCPNAMPAVIRCELGKEEYTVFPLLCVMHA